MVFQITNNYLFETKTDLVSYLYARFKKNDRFHMYYQFIFLHNKIQFSF